MLSPVADPAESAKTTASAARLRVLLLGWEYAPRLTGGLGTASVRLAHALAERVDLSVIVPRLPEIGPETEDEIEAPLSELASAADGPDQLRHFPESADWTDERPRRPNPVNRPVSGVFADREGTPSANPPALAAGWPVRLTALSHLTPAGVRASTAAPRPPGYEVFARQVRVLDVALPSPYADGPAELAVSSTEPAVSLAESTAKPAASAGSPAEVASNPVEPAANPTPFAANLAAAAAEPANATVSPAEPAENSAELAVNPAEPALSPDPLTEVLAPFRGPAINPLTLPSSNTEVVQFARLAARVASGDEVDVVYAHDWPTFLAGVEIRLEKRVPLVLHVHSTSYDRHGPPVQGWVFELERAAFRAADRVVAVSHYGAGVLTRHYGVAPERIRVVHHGLSAGPLGPQWEARPVGAAPTVLFVGRLTSQKNPLGFVEVARLVAAEVPDARFAVAGDGPQRAAVLAAAAAAELDEPQFVLLGFLDDEAVSATLAGAAVVCLPARSEPFGLAALEAAAAGVPLVMSTTTGAAEVLPGARTAAFDDAPALAAHVVELLRDEPARRRAVRENAAAARRLTWEQAADEVLAVLDDVSGQK